MIITETYPGHGEQTIEREEEKPNIKIPRREPNPNFKLGGGGEQPKRNDPTRIEPDRKQSPETPNPYKNDPTRITRENDPQRSDPTRVS